MDKAVEAARRELRDHGCSTQEICSGLPCECMERAITAADAARAVTEEEVQKIITQTLFDASYGGTSDTTLADMLASICDDNARNVIADLHAAGLKVLRV